MTATHTDFSRSFTTNQQLYNQLKQTLKLGLRQQIFIAVCDNLELQNQIANRLQTELAADNYLNIDQENIPANLNVPIETDSNLVTLHLKLADPDPIAQICQWKNQYYRSPLAFQILGVDQLTRQPLAMQWSFLNHLRGVESQIIEFELTLLLWISSPWLCCIQQSAPEFWRLHTGLFEFISDPTSAYDISPSCHDVKPTKKSSKSTSPVDRKINPNPQKIKNLTEGATSSQDCIQASLKRAYMYRDRISQGPSTIADLHSAIEAYNQVLEQLDHPELLLKQQQNLLKDLDPVTIWNDIGTFHWMLFRQTYKSINQSPQVITNLEMSIIFYQTALMEVNSDQNSYIHVKILTNLGAAYTDLATIRDPIENLKQSITVLRSAISYLKSEKYQGNLWQFQGLDYRGIQNNLGTAYWNLAQQTQPVVNLKAAIAAYGEALLGYCEKNEPMSYAMIQANLGTAYWNLAQHQPSKQLLEQAIFSYREALKYRIPKTAALACATTQNNLGTACWHLAVYQEKSQDRIKSLQEAIAAYEITLTLARQLSPTELTFDTLATHNNLGLAHYSLATDQTLSLTGQQRVSHLEKALSHHLIAGWQQPDPKDGSITPLGSKRHRVAFNYLIRTLRAFYQESGWQGQNQALSKIPGYLLPEIWRSL